MLREVIFRRYSRLIREEKPLPKLILIDGGRGHLSNVEKTIHKLKLSTEVDIACVAKGKLRTQFRKFTSTRKTNKMMLNEFVSLVA